MLKCTYVVLQGHRSLGKSLNRVIQQPTVD